MLALLSKILQQTNPEHPTCMAELLFANSQLLGDLTLLEQALQVS
jgi:hypothetical protein